MKKVSSFHILLALWLVMFAAQSCTQNEVSDISLPHTGNTLVIHTSMKGFIGDDASQTRVVDIYQSTKFESGDAIGIYILDDNGNIMGQEYANQKFVLTDDADVLRWIGENNTPLFFSKGATYVAYYPYDEELSFETDGVNNPEDFERKIVDRFTEKLAVADQSVEYPKLDVMTARATVAAEEVVAGTEINFVFTHQLAMVEIVLPAINYRVSASEKPYYSIPIATEPTFQKGDMPLIPYDLGNNIFRFLVTPGENIGIVKGNFVTAEGRFEYQSQNAISLKKGYYHRLNVIYGGSGMFEHTLQIGDFFMKDGTLLAKDVILTEEQKSNCIGIVFWLGDPTAERMGDPALRVECPDCTHGLVTALTSKASQWSVDNATDVASWITTNSEQIQIPDYCLNINIKSTDAEKKERILGYNNTIVLNKYNAFVSTDKQVIAVSTLMNNGVTAPDNTSGWFLPSIGELQLLLQNADVKQVLDTSLKKVNNTTLANTTFHWSSAEASMSMAWRVKNDLVGNGNKTFTPNVRAILAF